MSAGLANNSKWRGTIRAKCGVCNYSQDIEVVVPSSIPVAEREWQCPRCDAKTRIRVERMNTKEVEVT